MSKKLNLILKNTIIDKALTYASETWILTERDRKKYTKKTNKLQLCRIIYYSLAALHVSSDIFAHHQERLICITASGITHE